MKIKESEAIATAKKFTMEEHKESRISIVDVECKMSSKNDGFGHTVLGLNEAYWSITFMLKNTGPNAFYSGSEYFIVLVGAESGEPHWLPMM